MTPNGWDPATRFERFNAYVADLLLLAVIILVVTVVFGGIWPRALGGAFVLLRDVAGRSPGKRSCRLFIRNSQGGPAAVWQRIVRNLPLIVGPVTGDLATPIAVAGGVVGTADLLAFFLTGRRVGDRLADTWVVTAKRSPFAV